MLYDPQQIFNTAESFALAAARSFEQRSVGPGQIQLLMVPAVVCQAFAIELYFKALITLEGGTAKGHVLSELYSKVLPETQTAIRKSANLSEIELNKKLADASKAFVEWRYIFESQSAQMDLKFLSSMLGAAKLEAEKLLAERTSPALGKAPEGGT